MKNRALEIKNINNTTILTYKKIENESLIVIHSALLMRRLMLIDFKMNGNMTISNKSFYV